jgi:CHASE3 domain sensor protein
MEEETLKKIQEQEIKLDKIFRSVEKTRKYFLWTIIITVVTFLLPLIVLMFLIPKILSIYAGNALSF